MNLLLLLAIAFSAAIVASVTGFGAAIILTPFLSILVDVKSAIILVAIYCIAISIVRLILLRKGVEWRIFLLFGIPCVIAGGIASWIFVYLPVNPISWGVALFLILYSLYSLFIPGVRVPEKVSLFVVGGLLSGIISGLIGMPGGIRSAFLISTDLNKESYVATSTAIALATDVIRIVVYHFGGSMKGLSLAFIPSLMTAGIVGTFAGIWLLGRLKEEYIQKTVLVAILILGLIMIYDLNY